MKKGNPNFTRLSKIGMPIGTGKKGDKPPRKRQCAETVHTFTPMNVSKLTSLSTHYSTSSHYHSSADSPSLCPPSFHVTSMEGTSNSVAASVTTLR